MKSTVFKRWAYLAVIMFYACIFALAVNYQQNNAGMAPHTTEIMTDSCRMDSVLRPNIHAVITWNPESVRKAKMDTVRQWPLRYIQKGTGGLQTGDEAVDDALRMRTDIFAEFVKRFNANPAELKRLQGIDFTRAGTLELRTGCILSLVNEVDVLTLPAVRGFAEKMVNDSLFIDYVGGTDLACVATIAYRDTLGHEFPVRLTFRRGVVNEAPVWFITEAESPYFTYGDSDKPKHLHLTEAEMQFLGLVDDTDRSAKSLAGPDFRPDGRTAFLMLASRGFIRYQWCIDTSFVLALGEYLVLVEEVESFVHMRSGFLITRIVKDGELVFENRNKR